ncbi:hypothetical protein HDU96_010275 [Phlyctochytrium bullatum]|nr:hypothetical protein HDU96_010275 [Phlyctochytrium bullatum]
MSSSLRVSYQNPAGCKLELAEWTNNIANPELCDTNTVVMTCNAPSGWRTSWSGNATTSAELRQKAVAEIAEALKSGTANAACDSIVVAKPSENWGLVASKAKPTSSKPNSAKKGSASLSFGSAVVVSAIVMALLASPVNAAWCDGPYCELSGENVGMRGCDPWYGFGDAIWTCGSGSCPGDVTRSIQCQDMRCNLKLEGNWGGWSDRELVAKALQKLFQNQVWVDGQWECVCNEGGCNGRPCFGDADNATTVDEAALGEVRPNRPACGRGCNAVWTPGFNVYHFPRTGTIKGREKGWEFAKYSVTCTQSAPSNLAWICPFVSTGLSALALGENGAGVSFLGSTISRFIFKC